MSGGAPDKRQEIEDEKKSTLCRLHCKNKQPERDTKRRHSLASVTSSCTFKLKEQNQYCVNVALCPPAPIFPLLMAFLSQFREFCSHSHQPHLNRRHHLNEGLHQAAHDPPSSHAHTLLDSRLLPHCATHTSRSRPLRCVVHSKSTNETVKCVMRNVRPRWCVCGSC